MGVEGYIDGEKSLWKRKLMNENKISYKDHEKELIRLEEEAKQPC